MRISDWSSDVCSSDLIHDLFLQDLGQRAAEHLHQREGEAVHPHVVVFKVGTRLPQVAVRALPRVVESGAHPAIASDETRLSRTGTFTLPCLGQQQKAAGWETRWSVRVELGGRRVFKKKKT